MKRFLNRRSVLGGLLLIGSLIAVAWFMRGPRDEISRSLPDLTDAHPTVVAALQSLENDLRREPSSASRWGELGMVLMAHGWTAEAANAFEHAARIDPEKFRWAYLRAMLLETDDLRQAAEAYAHAAAIDPNYAALRVRWAQVLIRLDQLPAAEEQLRAAVQLAPQSPHPLLALGRAAIDRKDFSAARTYFQKRPASPRFVAKHAYNWRAVNFLLGDRQQAERDQSLASRLPPTFPGLDDPIFLEVNRRELVARQSAERADQWVARGDVAAATAAFEQLIQDRPDLSRPRLNLAALLARRGDMRNAAARYREIIELFPSEALAHQGLGGILAGAGDIDGAIAAYQECIRLKPDYAQAHHALGMLVEQQGKREEAISAYRAAIHADPRYAPAYMALGAALEQKGEIDAAVAAIETAIHLAPYDAVPRRHLQRVHQTRSSTTNRQDAERENQGKDEDVKRKQ